jgi:hypothetical protein
VVLKTSDTFWFSGKAEEDLCVEDPLKNYEIGDHRIPAFISCAMQRILMNGKAT